RPCRLIEKVTGIPKATTSDWFRYQHFPRWETFTEFLGFFDDPAHRSRLEALWKEAWPAEQRARRVGQAQPAAEDDRPAGSGGAGGRWRRRTGAWLTAASAAALVAVAPTAWHWVTNHHGGTSVTDSQRRCARVNAATSPVYLNVGDTKPHKIKYRGNQVQ